MGSDILTENNKKESVLKSLSDFPKSIKNEETRTLIQKMAYDKFYEDREQYYNLLRKKPEFRPFELENEKENPEDIKKITVTYNDNVRGKNLYYDSFRKPIKVLSPRTLDNLSN